MLYCVPNHVSLRGHWPSCSGDNSIRLAFSGVSRDRAALITCNTHTSGLDYLFVWEEIELSFTINVRAELKKKKQTESNTYNCRLRCKLKPVSELAESLWIISSFKLRDWWQTEGNIWSRKRVRNEAWPHGKHCWLFGNGSRDEMNVASCGAVIWTNKTISLIFIFLYEYKKTHLVKHFQRIISYFQNSSQVKRSHPIGRCFMLHIRLFD